MEKNLEPAVSGLISIFIKGMAVSNLYGWKGASLAEYIPPATKALTGFAKAPSAN